MKWTRRGVALALAIAAPAALEAQDVVWRSAATFYGDNTEFFTPFRVGETIFGGQVRSELRVATSSRTEVLAGVFGDLRWGSDEFLDEVKPILSFRYRTATSTGVLGTLVTERRHGFLDALAVSTLELTRPVEYGAQWLERRPAWDLDAFLSWRALNTPEHREKLDFGWVLRVRPIRRLTLESQRHGLHQGGQLFDAGRPVTNNNAWALGVALSDTLGPLGSSALGLYHLWSTGNLDPDAPASRPREGRGTLVRASVTPGGAVEVFGIYWRGRDFLAQDGDPNYGSVGVDPDFYRSRRRYIEVGALKRARLDGGVTIDAEFRFHRVDRERSVAIGFTNWEYSYRLVVRAPFDVVLRRAPAP